VDGVEVTPDPCFEEPAMPIAIPDACTLPTAERPLRLAEFDALFATAVRQVDTVGPTRARMRLTGKAGLAATVRDLTARETGCCSFFTFTVTPEPADAGEALTLDVEVPQRYADVLASLAERAGTIVAGLRLEVRMPGEAAGMLAAVVGLPDTEVRDAAPRP
jgi:hypothetical protein